ncbi:hypothetical protein K461DRAFT_268342 [Myriangium duriaei CBS 260.36]|uniref:Disintegrin domain-containing protein n=1 Tax=Myriangium duriaei CBS 260.36 TaxID=1168546 RepID=A0A9P4MFH3_9PEZI|nr:hypothetical protein K461DRAFT_268342 [Myriangium duriaei CBS 260.36]
MFVTNFALLFSALLATTAAQTCYFPDKITPSQDIPCNAGSVQGSSCCPADSFCMSNGLCMNGGVLSRGTCTDQTWQSGACTDACTNSNLNQNISITPCGGSNFTCGLNTTACTTGENVFTISKTPTLVLRPSQIAQLVGGWTHNYTSSQNSSGSSAFSSSASSATTMYPGSTVIAIGLGLGFPLAMALVSCFVLLRKLRTKRTVQMYEPPDHTPARRMASPRPSISTLGRSPTVRTMRSFNTLSETPSPAIPRSFLDRYTPKPKEEEKAEVYEMDMGKPRYELGSHMSASPKQMAELNGSQPDLVWIQNQK